MTAPTISRESQWPDDSQYRVALAGAHSRQAIAKATPISAAPAGSDSERGQGPHDAQAVLVPLGSATGHDQCHADAHDSGVVAGSNSPAHQSSGDNHRGDAGGGADSDTDQDTGDAQGASVGVGQTPAGTANGLAVPGADTRSLLDPLLTLASITLDDLEALRIAQENRYRSLTEHGVSENGVEWGYGLDDNDAQVAQAGAIVDSIKALEHQAALNLQRLMRKHPLGPWVKAQRGIGDKQAARLLGVIGDPYWHTAEDRPRTVSELWAYCGLHTLPARQSPHDTQRLTAGGEYNIAARRRKGQQANWSDEAKKRAWLIATSCLKAGGPYREVYDQRRATTADREHAVECVRCGPSGKPAQPGTPWSPGHQHADALRITSKAILRDLWREARRIHQEVSR